MLHCIESILEPEPLALATALIDECDFVDGKSTAGKRARRVKRNEQLRRGAHESAVGDDPRRQLDTLVQQALDEHAEFSALALPRRIALPLISRYRPGMHYGAHVDDALMGGGARLRSDLAVTVFLSDPASYDGGELFVGASYGEIAVKLPAGDAVVYSADTVHRVAPVTSGERLAAITWVQSQVRCPRQRELLTDLGRVRRRLEQDCGDSDETDLAGKSYSNLMRMWADG